jgi:hypothetical protein
MFVSAAGCSACHGGASLPTARPEGPLKRRAVRRKERDNSSRDVHTVEQRPPAVWLSVRCNAALVLKQLNQAHTQHVSCIHAPLQVGV